MDERIPERVLEALGLPPAVPAEPVGAGHIHRTWIVPTPSGRVVVQRLNDSVFARPAHVLENAAAVARHLLAKRAAGDYPLEVPRPIAAVGPTGAGATWRAMEYVEDTFTVDVVQSALQARTAAGAFGAFCAAMADFEPNDLHVVIPRFHDLPGRVADLRAAFVADRMDRASRAGDAMRRVAGHQRLVDEVAALAPGLPRRVCHNDTKINNMLFDKGSQAARAVIDLDTCMPGYWMHDYGDMVRTFCSPEPEDSTRLDDVHVREDVFAALTEGFLAPTARLMEPTERQSLFIGACAMCLTVGVRFLTDWLDGDRYFATSHPDHNLDRARNQFALLADLAAKRSRLSRYL